MHGVFCGMGASDIAQRSENDFQFIDVKLPGHSVSSHLEAAAMSLGPILKRERPSWLQLFVKSPSTMPAKTMYSWRTGPEEQVSAQPVTIVCTSDTHNSQPAIPRGDIFVHAGDLTQGGTAKELQVALDWINSLPHAHKIVIAGNHDLILDAAKTPDDDDLRTSLNWGSIHYLQESTITLKLAGGRSLVVHGNPWTRKQGNWAFQYERGHDKFTATVPDDVDILITHSPPRFHLDIDGFGEDYLTAELWRVKPRVHVFGHIHEGYGKDFLTYDAFEKMYEEVCGGRKGLGTIVQMMMTLYWSFCYGPKRRACGTSLVNAAAVRGLKDDLKRQAIVVRI